MSHWRTLVMLLAMGSVLWAEDQPTVIPQTLGCATGLPGSPACVSDSTSLKQAKQAFQRGIKHQKENKLDAALDEFKKAADLVPRNVEYVTMRELVKQQLVFDHLQRGNGALADGRQILAMGEFRSALTKPFAPRANIPATSPSRSLARVAWASFHPVPCWTSHAPLLSTGRSFSSRS